jgi:hypothetical protein
VSDTVFHPLQKIGDPVQQGVMTLIAKQGDQMFPIGTGFKPDRLLVTAVHVIHQVEELAVSRIARVGTSCGRQLSLPCLYHFSSFSC